MILACNDDGIQSEGLTDLVKAVGAVDRVVVVAPDRERSAVSHALTLDRPLRADEVREGWFAVTGTPTDCVNLAVNGLLSERPWLVVSGINRGANLGDDITYSGTVSAAMEGTLLGIPSVAISLVRGDERWLEGYEPVVRRLAERIVSAPVEELFPRDTLLNINLPDVDPTAIEGVKVTSLGKRIYVDPIVVGKDPQGKDYYWIGGGAPTWTGPEESDFLAVEAGFVSITPIYLDLTHREAMADLERWRKEAFGNGL